MLTLSTSKAIPDNDKVIHCKILFWIPHIFTKRDNHLLLLFSQKKKSSIFTVLEIKNVKMITHWDVFLFCLFVCLSVCPCVHTWPRCTERQTDIQAPVADTRFLRGSTNLPFDQLFPTSVWKWRHKLGPEIRHWTSTRVCARVLLHFLKFNIYWYFYLLCSINLCSFLSSIRFSSYYAQSSVNHNVPAMTSKLWLTGGNLSMNTSYWTLILTINKTVAVNVGFPGRLVI